MDLIEVRSFYITMTWINGITNNTDCDLSHKAGTNVFSEGENEVAAAVIGVVLIFATTTYLT